MGHEVSGDQAVQRTLRVVSADAHELASELGVSTSAVQAWKAGNRSPTRDNLQRLARLADERADQLRGLAVELRRLVSDRHLDP